MEKFSFPGDIHFVTFRTYKNKPYLQEEKYCQLFLENLDYYRQKYDFKIPGYCLMPDHAHLLVYFDLEKYPELTISKIVQEFKSHSARDIIDKIKKSGSRELLLSAQIESNPCMEQGLHATQRDEDNKNHRRGLKYRIWQTGFYDFNIYTQNKFEEKLNYIHNNPITTGLVTDISQYKYCSAQNYLLDNHDILKIDLIEF